MLLEVPYESFAQEIKKRLGVVEAFAVETSKGVFLTAADPNSNTIISALSQDNLDEIKTYLGHSEIKIQLGEWCIKSNIRGHKFDPEFYISVVAYDSNEQKPGIWVDASISEPNTTDILTNIYNEFSSTAEIPDIGLESFILKAKPNVLILHSKVIQHLIENNDKK